MPEVPLSRDRMQSLVSAWSKAVATNDTPWLEANVAPALRDGVAARTRAVHGAFRDIVVTPIDVVVEGDAVAWRFHLAGTHVGPIGGIAATGRAVVLEGVNFQRVREGIVVVEHWTTVSFAPLTA